MASAFVAVFTPSQCPLGKLRRSAGEEPTRVELSRVHATFGARQIQMPSMRPPVRVNRRSELPAPIATVAPSPPSGMVGSVMPLKRAATSLPPASESSSMPSSR